jgi:hypothetical protein
MFWYSASTRAVSGLIAIMTSYKPSVHGGGRGRENALAWAYAIFLASDGPFRSLDRLWIPNYLYHTIISEGKVVWDA